MSQLSLFSQISPLLVGKDSQKSIIWASLTLLAAISGYWTGEISPTTAAIMSIGGLQGVFLWLRAQKLQAAMKANEVDQLARIVPHIPSVPYTLSPEELTILSTMIQQLKEKADADTKKRT